MTESPKSCSSCNSSSNGLSTDKNKSKETFIVAENKLPFKQISLSLFLLFFGLIGISFGIYMLCSKMGGGYVHGALFSLLGIMVFVPGMYYSRIALYAYKGYKGFSFSDIPAV